MEDQVAPKRCGHMEGKQVIPYPEMEGKLKAAMDCRDSLDPDFIIIYRIDAIAVNGYQDALERAKRAVDLGVDMIFIEALETREQIELTARELNGTPLMLNLVEGGKTPLIPLNEADEMGYKWIVPALSTLYSAARGMFDVMSEIKKNGVSEKYMDKLISFRDFTEVIHLDDIRNMEEEYLPRQVIEEKYHGKDRIVD
jgi:methylisocitrate lyase